MLFPGGAGNYREIGSYIYDSIVDFNDAGTWYPLWGTCLGYENMARFASDSGNPLSDQVSINNSLTLDFLVDPATTTMFGDLEDASPFSKEAMTFNHHNYGLSVDIFS